MNNGDRKRRVRLWAAIVAVCIVAASIIAYTYYSGDWSLSTSGNNSGVTFNISNLTANLNGMFDPGSIQGLGYNTTAVLALGVGYYNKATDYNKPVLAELSMKSGTFQSSNLTGDVAPYFAAGGLFGAAFNGSAWLLTGVAIWGSTHTGELVTLSGGTVSNITGLVPAYFDGGGIWVDAWNGTGWLIGGNSSTGSVLLSLQGRTVTDLSGILPNNVPGDWIQLIAWNGSGWFIGGRGTAGTLYDGKYTDVLQNSVFKNSGVFAASPKGNDWMIGGGPPAAIEMYSGGKMMPQASLPGDFNSWVNGIIDTGSGWLIGGKGSQPGYDFLPELAYLPDSSSGTGSAVDLSSRLPSAFQEGQIQAMISSPLGAAGTYLLAGQGNYNNTTGSGTGALAQVTLGSSTAVSYAGTDHGWISAGTAEERR